MWSRQIFSPSGTHQNDPRSLGVGADQRVRGLRRGSHGSRASSQVCKGAPVAPFCPYLMAGWSAAARRAPRAARCMCAAVGGARRAAERRRRGVGGGSGAAGEETELDQSVRAFARLHPLCIADYRTG